MHTVDIAILCALLGVSLVTCDFCQDNFTLSELPKGIMNDVLSIFTIGTLAGAVGCPARIKIEDHNIRFWLWTNDNPQTPVHLDHKKPKGLHENSSVIFLIHGWLCNVSSDRIPELKDAYLQRYSDANVIGIEWTTYATDLYVNAFCSIPLIAEVVAGFVHNLNKNYGFDLNDVHFVGHSMGAHIAGLAGKSVQRLGGGKVRRITGLDPAGPLYQILSESRRLDASDAHIVDVIHTNQLHAGFFGACGTVDFYPNCGYFQPGCWKIPKIVNSTGLIETPISVIACSHLRSVDYHLESILSNKFDARSCVSCPGLPLIGPCIADFVRASSTVMGENYPKYRKIGSKYYLTTNSEAPYAKGF